MPMPRTWLATLLLTALSTAFAQSPELTVSAAIAETEESQAFRSAGGDEDALLTRYGYQRQEYFVSGATSKGPYQTRVLIVRPRVGTQFSGILVAEIFQTSVWLQVRDYMMRSHHGWVMISSRGNNWQTLLKRANPQRYAQLQIPADELNPEILYQVSSLLRERAAPNPAADLQVRKVILAGYSGDGAAVRQFIEQHHAQSKIGGRWAFDGYFVAATAVGSAPRPIADIELPVLEVMNENEMIRSFERGSGSLAYRRDDGAHYRLYELPGVGHITTRNVTAERNPYAAACQEGPQSPLAMNHLYSNALHRLLLWVDEDRAPPHMARIQYEADGKTLRRDEHGNALGGVRSTYLDVPVARYVAVSTKRASYTGDFNRCDMIAHVVPFERAKLTKLYRTHALYAALVAKRVDQLVKDGGYLEADAAEIKAEAQAYEWPEDRS